MEITGETMELSRRRFIQTAGISAFGIGFCGCHSTPITGRKSVILVPEGQEVALGVKAFDDALSQEKPSQNTRLAEIVKRVGNRIAAVSDRSDYDWDFRLIESPTQNAFALPGGKVAIYEGILPVCQDEAGLAVVMSHEVAHALARHGGERMSQDMISNGIKNVVGHVTKSRIPEKHELLMQYYGHGSKLVGLHYSRQQESEADHMGVIMMAKAGYDPTSAPGFWTRFGEYKNKGEQTPEWLSTHPTDSRRASDLMALMDEANSYYEKAGTKIGKGESLLT